MIDGAYNPRVGVLTNPVPVVRNENLLNRCVAAKHALSAVDPSAVVEMGGRI
jgi:hypothetical protein